MYPCVVHEARVQTGAKDGGSWKSRLYEIQRPEKIIPRPLPRRPFKAATQLRNFVYCVVCKKLRIAEVKSGEDSIFFFLFSFPSSFQVWPSFALWPVYVRVGFIKSYSYHLVAFIQWRIPLLKQKKNIILLRSCYSSLFQFDRDCSIFLYFIVCSGFRLQRYRNNHSVSLTTSRDGKLYTSQWRSSATSSKRVYRLPDNLKIVSFTDRSKIKKKEKYWTVPSTNFFED